MLVLQRDYEDASKKKEEEIENTLFFFPKSMFEIFGAEH